ncbi:DUF4238 domain-containing protein [Brevundimonas diminuta]|uniref:DUF4238 domain-containing protein n=1 Tax=Brevundimonas diminuta TaxID=293 RepID=A0A1Z3LWE9_BREDI|nr:DUF4238 domain-containing protein [Brevundimonas diminuta]ASD26542.1 hypothetical protein CD943_06325 [Brevundimonas diminuta]
MAKQVTKRCHWVSQSYLKAFAADEAGQKIWRFSKNDGDPELKPIENVAVRFYLYAPMAADGTRDDPVERKLSELEQWFGEPIWKALCKSELDLTWEPLRKMLALIVATTYVRNPVQFETWKRIHRQMVEQVSGLESMPTRVTIGGVEHQVDASDWPDFRDAGEERMKAAWNDYIAGAGDIAPRLLGMRMVMVAAKKPVFITSDNPVTITHPSLEFRGIRDPETTISFPISPTRMLVLDNRHSEPDGVYYELADDNAAAQNLLVWRNAMEHMFSHRHTDEVCAEFVANEDRFLAAQ